MTDLDKINSIITKARMLRKSEHVTPREFMLSDLVEALAFALKEHLFDPHCHIRTIGAPPLGALPAPTPLLDKDPAPQPDFSSWKGSE